MFIENYAEILQESELDECNYKRCTYFRDSEKYCKKQI